MFVGEPSESSVFLVNFEEFIGRGDITYTKLLEKSDESFALKNGLVCVGTKFVLIILFTVVPHGFELLFVIVKDGYDWWLGEDLFGQFLDGFLDLVFLFLVL